jgi:hypothetical protein
LSEAAARALLADFLDRVERQPERQRRVMSRPNVAPGSLEEREAFEGLLKRARNLRAIDLEYGRGDAGHLIERVVLRDPAPLYDLLGRRPLADRLAEARDGLVAALPGLAPEVAAERDNMLSYWATARSYLGVGIDHAEEAVELLRVFEAVFRRDPDDTSDLRTYSRQATGNSKLIESHRSQIAAWLRRIGRVPDDLDDAEAMIAVGLEKFPPHVLIAGPVQALGADFGALPYVGLPPPAVRALSPTRPVRSVLTVENLASFNRHVTEARQRGDVVIYTGGYPSRVALQAMATAFSWNPDACYHWGDIDRHGLHIALRIAVATGAALRPHLMDAGLARAHGTEVRPKPLVSAAAGTAFATLAEFLASPSACHMEQEEIAPEPTPAQGPL